MSVKIDDSSATHRLRLSPRRRPLGADVRPLSRALPAGRWSYAVIVAAFAVAAATRLFAFTHIH